LAKIKYVLYYGLSNLGFLKEKSNLCFAIKCPYTNGAIPSGHALSLCALFLTRFL